MANKITFQPGKVYWGCAMVLGRTLTSNLKVNIPPTSFEVDSFYDNKITSSHRIEVCRITILTGKKNFSKHQAQIFETEKECVDAYNAIIDGVLKECEAEQERIKTRMQYFSGFQYVDGKPKSNKKIKSDITI